MKVQIVRLRVVHLAQSEPKLDCTREPLKGGTNKSVTNLSSSTSTQNFCNIISSHVFGFKYVCKSFDAWYNALFSCVIRISVPGRAAALSEAFHGRIHLVLGLIISSPAIVPRHRFARASAQLPSQRLLHHPIAAFVPRVGQ
jgi:hypothetical protein